jgi:hypothetical protein
MLNPYVYEHIRYQKILEKYLKKGIKKDKKLEKKETGGGPVSFN